VKLTFFEKLLSDLEGGKHFFNTVREGDSVLFATEDEQDAHNWVMAFYRATGQAHKPSPPVTTGKSSVLSSNQGGKQKCLHCQVPRALCVWMCVWSPYHSDLILWPFLFH
jgi:hypothetical protein